MRVAHVSVYDHQSDRFRHRLKYEGGTREFDTKLPASAPGEFPGNWALLREEVGVDTPLEFRSFTLEQVMDGQMQEWLDAAQVTV